MVQYCPRCQLQIRLLATIWRTEYCPRCLAGSHRTVELIDAPELERALHDRFHTGRLPVIKRAEQPETAPRAVTPIALAQPGASLAGDRERGAVLRTMNNETLSEWIARCEAMLARPTLGSSARRRWHYLLQQACAERERRVRPATHERTR